MKIDRYQIISFVIVILVFSFGLMIYPMMPDKMASHWNSSGEVDGYMSKFWGVFILPLVLLISLILLWVIPRIDPRRENIDQFKNYFNQFVIIFLLFFVYLYGLTIWWNLGGRFNMTIFIIPAFSVLFVYIGKLLKRAKLNYTIGIRTPWTLANEEVWMKTHQLGSKVFYWVAFLILLGLFLPQYAFIIFLSIIFGAVLLLTVYSYIIFRQITKK